MHTRAPVGRPKKRLTLTELAEKMGQDHHGKLVRESIDDLEASREAMRRAKVSDPGYPALVADYEDDRAKVARRLREWKTFSGRSYYDHLASGMRWTLGPDRELYRAKLIRPPGSQRPQHKKRNKED